MTWVTTQDSDLGPQRRIPTHTTIPVRPHFTPGPGANYGRESTYRDLTDGPCHVMVIAGDGPRPGLLVEWRKHAQLPWEGLVWHGRLIDGQWRTVCAWLPAGSITPV